MSATHCPNTFGGAVGTSAIANAALKEVNAAGGTHYL